MTDIVERLRDYPKTTRHEAKILRSRCLDAANEIERLRAEVEELTEMVRDLCIGHPDDNPPVPCPQKFALTECRIAAAYTMREEFEAFCKRNGAPYSQHEAYDWLMWKDAYAAGFAAARERAAEIWDNHTFPERHTVGQMIRAMKADDAARSK